MAVLRTQEDFDGIFEYIDYLEFCFKYLHDQMSEEYDQDEMKGLVNLINEKWYYGDY